MNLEGFYSNSKYLIIKSIVSTIIGMLLMIFALLAYIPVPNRMIEILFISNIIMGCIFILAGCIGYNYKKDLANVIYHLICVMMVANLVISIISKIKYNPYNIVLFISGPILSITFYMIFCRELPEKFWKLSLCPIPLVCYLFFDLIYGLVNKKFIYEIIRYRDKNVAGIIMILLFVCIYTVIIGFVIFKCNIRVHRRYKLQKMYLDQNKYDDLKKKK